jgi:hypothetical protein
MSPGALSGYDDRPDIALNLIESSLQPLVSSQPFLGPFNSTLKRGINFFKDFKTSKANAKSFLYRLCDVVIVVDETLKLTRQDGGNGAAGYMELIIRVVGDLRGIVFNSMKFFGAFNKKGFLGTMMASNKASDKFVSYDKQLTTKLNELTSGFGVHQHSMAVTTFKSEKGVESLVHDLGGLQAVSHDVMKVNALAQKLGAISTTILFKPSATAEILFSISFILLGDF